LWVAARNAGAIDSVTTAGAVQAYSLPVSGSQPGAIVKAPDGTLWFSDQQGFIGTFVW
jgi:streptogramin lyase